MSTIKVDTIATRTGSGNITASNTIAGTSATLSGTLAVTGDLTVDTSTLKVDSSNNLVGVGTSAPSGAKLEIFTGSTSSDGLKINRFGSGVYYSTLRQDSHGLAIHVGDGSTIAERVAITPNGITFNGDTAAVNALDDYEEGTLVPSLSCTNSNTGITYTTQVGRYVKIGNKVHVVLYIELSSKGSASGNVRISGAGFPFTPISTSGFVQTGHVAMNGAVNGQQFAGQNHIWGQLSPGDATFRIYADSDGDVVQLDTGDIDNDTSFRVNMSYFV